MIDLSLLFYLTNVRLVADWGDDPLMPLDGFKVDVELVPLTQTVLLLCSVLVAILVARTSKWVVLRKGQKTITTILPPRTRQLWRRRAIVNVGDQCRRIVKLGLG